MKAIFEYKEVKEPIAAILNPSELVKFEDITNENVTALVTTYNDQKLFVSILVFVDIAT